MNNKTISRKVGASFRDPSGYVFRREGVVYRNINLQYRNHYKWLMSSGLYDFLVQKRCLVAHEEVGKMILGDLETYKTIMPQQVPFISYPYEWCFSQLKDAALLTLQIQRIALSFGMTLKDASAFNIQYYKGDPVLIDTLSFEVILPDRPWSAYAQFCRHFLAPLLMMCSIDAGINKTLEIFGDGIPLRFASSILSWNTWLRLGALLHIHLHSRSEEAVHRFAVINKMSPKSFSAQSFRRLIDNLEGAIDRLALQDKNTVWSEYYGSQSVDDSYLDSKSEVVTSLIKYCSPRTVWDFGSNTGRFSRVASALGAEVVSFDSDPICVERDYAIVKKNSEQNVLPLLMDLNKPSPSIGWNGEERDSLFDRGPVDLVMILALIHHLAISNNVPFAAMAQMFQRMCRFLIIEFIPKTDDNVAKLLLSRQDVFWNYDEKRFESEFGVFFHLVKKYPISNSGRNLYLFRNKKVL